MGGFGGESEGEGAMNIISETTKCKLIPNFLASKLTVSFSKHLIHENMDPDVPCPLECYFVIIALKYSK